MANRPARRGAQYNPKTAKNIRSSGRRLPGATKAVPRANWTERWRKVKKGMGYFLLFSVAGFGIIALVELKPHERIKKVTNKPISQIQIEGDFLYLSKNESVEFIQSFIEDGLLNLNIKELKEKLESTPWVDKAAVSRTWPDKLKVVLLEEKPIARWGNQGFLNMKGDIIQAKRLDQLQALPLLVGRDEYAKKIMEHYLAFNQQLSSAELRMNELYLDDTQNWRVKLTDGLEIKLGRERLHEKLRQVVDAKQGVLAEQYNKIKVIDFRYHNGFAVSWKQDDALLTAANQ